MIRLLLMLMFLVSMVAGQEIQKLRVRGFTGGLVNSVANSLMDSTQALVLVNYDLDDYGALTRRAGMTVHYADTGSGPLAALFPYHSGLSKKLFVLRWQDGYHPDLVDSTLYVVTECNDAQQKCTTAVYRGAFPANRDLTQPFNSSYTTLTGKYVLAATGTEMLLYNEDSSWMYPARPLAPGQMKVVGYNGAGPLTGTYRYKYAFVENGGSDTSNFSVPSWRVTVNRGKVGMFGFDTCLPAAIDGYMIYRETDGDGQFEKLAYITCAEDAFFDTFATTTDADTANYPWGWDSLSHNRPVTLRAPGAPIVSLNMSGTPEIGAYWTLNGTRSGQPLALTDTVYMGWRIAYEDINGVRSMPGPSTWAYIDDIDSLGGNGAADDNLDAELTRITLPLDSGIAKMILLRSYSYPIDQSTAVREEDTILVGAWWEVADWLLDSASWFDRLALSPTSDDPDESLIRCAATYTDGGWFPIASNRFWETDSGEVFATEPPESTCYNGDTLVSFTPVALTEHGARLYAVGDQANVNHLYFSEFGLPWRWPYDKFLSISTQSGDWFNNLLSIGNDNLLAFRQNSVWAVTGLSFYQYSVNRLVDGVGLDGPRSLASSNGRIFFAHETGVYVLGGDKPISWPIQNTVDSAADKIQRSWGGIVGDEYWWSLAMDGETLDKTYIYSEDPRPHWKCYDFGVKDMVPYDYDTLVVDFRANRWIMIVDNDSLWRWGYGSRALDYRDQAIKLTIISIQDSHVYGFALELDGVHQCAPGATVQWTSPGSGTTNTMIVDSLLAIIDTLSCYDTLLVGEDSGTYFVVRTLPTTEGVLAAIHEPTDFDTTTIKAIGEYIVARYQSKYFLDGPERFKVLGIDFEGTGSCDSAIVALYEEDGDTILIDTMAWDFTDDQREWLRVDRIVEDISVSITDLGYGQYSLKGYTIEYIYWDEGMLR